MASRNPSSPPVQIPQDVLDLLSRIFADCNDDVAGTLSRIPTTHEDALDQLLISNLDRIAPERAEHSGWIVNVETHFLGGGHHVGRWEIADIGILVILRRGRRTWSKVAILQSKRLFPQGAKHDPADAERLFRWGFGRLVGGYTPVRAPRTFEFTDASRYESLNLKDGQATRVSAYEAEMLIPVHYMLYNPVTIPWQRSLPTAANKQQLPKNDIGCRIVRATQLQALEASGISIPRYGDVSTIAPPHALAPFEAGWRLEDFIVALLLGCHEGKVLDQTLDETLELLFYRRTYPIAAAVAVNLEVAD